MTIRKNGRIVVKRGRKKKKLDVTTALERVESAPPSIPDNIVKQLKQQIKRGRKKENA
jgi:rRNA-processing protein FCF1